MKSANLLTMLYRIYSNTHTHTHTVPVYYNTVASHHMILHSRRYRCSATMMTSRHPFVPEHVQLSTAQTLLAGWCVINTSCSTVNDTTLALIQTTAVSTQSTNCQKAKEKLQTQTEFNKRSVRSSTSVPSFSDRVGSCLLASSCNQL